MATRSWSTFFSHDTDVDFRTWGQEIGQELSNVGIVKTTDTGQIDWNTAVKPLSTFADAGFEVWRFNDSLQSVSPLYFKFTFGNGASVTTPRLVFQFGTGSDGAGNLTGIVSIPGNISMDTSVLIPGSFQSYLSHSEGFLSLNFKTKAYAAQTLNFANFIICRSVDTLGNVTGDAAIVYYGGSVNSASFVNSVQSFAFGASPRTFNVTPFVSLVPGSENNSLVNVDVQVYSHWMLTPQVRPVFGVGTVFNTEITLGSTFNATLVGSQTRTFISVANQGHAYWNSSNIGSNGLAVLWE